MSQEEPRILIIDDEYYLGLMLAQALNNDGFMATAVTDVDSAINWLQKDSFELVVSDIFLPGKNGMDLFNHVQKNHIDAPFIFMTGNPDLEIAVNFLTSGGYDYIVKPFMIPDFIKKVKSVIRLHAQKKKEQNLVKDLRSLLAKRLSELKIYHDAFESTDDGVIITDMDGIIVRVNRGFEKISGLKSNELQQKHLNVLQPVLLPDLLFEKIVVSIHQENRWKMQMITQTRQEDDVFLNISFYPIRNEAGQIFAYAGFFKDVTNQRQVEQAYIRSLRQMNRAQEAVIFGLARLAEHRDQDTGYHLERIRSYCKTLALKLREAGLYSSRIDDEFIQMLWRTAPLHDIGKVSIPDYILLKNEKLTDPEFEIMKSHTTVGYHIIHSISEQYGEMPFTKIGTEITHCHHEKWNGTGYPRKLKGDKIPLSARILAIADVYDALTSKRTYKDAFSHTRALEIMRKERGKHFCPDILDIFLEYENTFDEIRKRIIELEIKTDK
ncbi:MAG: HD domain-containing phosphohydrolase, partial [Calditrichia bacterium]